MILRPYQQRAINALYSYWIAHQGHDQAPLLVLPTGCHARGSRVVMMDGTTKAVEDVTVGDVLIGPDSAPRNVLRTVSGVEPMYRITPLRGGAPFVVNENHILSLMTTNEGKNFPCSKTAGQTETISVKDYLAKAKSWRHLRKLHRAAHIVFAARSDPEFDPWALGALLGDGCIKYGVRFTSPDIDILDALLDVMRGYGLDFGKGTHSRTQNQECWHVSFTDETASNIKPNNVVTLLRKIGVFGTVADTKYVPEEYKCGSLETRANILAGLLDTDGHLSRGSGYDFISKSRHLSEDVVFIARSLGITAVISECQKYCQTGGGGTYWRVSLSGEMSWLPMRCARKQALPRQQIKNPRVTGFKIDPVGCGEFFGFTLDADHLYLTDDFVVHHNSGKSVVISELTRLLWDTWPEDRPRTVVIVPSKELAEQNAAKLHAMLPTHLTIGYYSASIGQKAPTADVIVATIGSVYKAAHLLGNIKCVLIDEAHLINPDGAESGRYRQFLNDLARYCTFRVVGLTATPFRGNGIWLTDGDAPLFTGVACTVKPGELLEAGHLARLKVPVEVTSTRIDTDGISATGGDYNVGQLSDRVEQYLESAADEAVRLAEDRRAWIAFTPTVANAQHFAAALRERGVSAEVVTGDTPKAERQAHIEAFRAHRVRCLVTVLALAVGFDVPAVDCIIWLRPTRSPVLYCFDTETEILTSHGWKGVDDVRVGDCALAMDMDSQSGKWSRVLGVVRRPMESTEQWVEYEAPRANFRVTDQHRMIFKTKRESPWRIGTAAEMAAYRDSVYMPTSVNIDQPGVPLTDDELYLIGMLMTDGTWSPVQAQISQSERYPQILRRIEETLDRMNIQWSKKKILADSNFIQRFDRWVFTVSMGEPRKGSTRNGIRYLQPYLHKDLAPALMALSKSQFVNFIDGMWDGDGVKMAYVTEWAVRGKTIVSARKTCIERLQALATMHGFTAHLRWEYNGRKNPLGVITIKDQNWRSVGGPHAERRPKVVIKPATMEDVWCVETEHGTVVTRRRGKVTVMGNCQGAGRGMRPADGKTDCLWIDFTDTTQRMGPVDQIKGRNRPKKPSEAQGAPFRICVECGERSPVAALECPSCGAMFPEPEKVYGAAAASDAPVMSVNGLPLLMRYDVSRMAYAIHNPPGKPEMLRVDYHAGLRRVACEYVCFEHGGFASAKAAGWWTRRSALPVPATSRGALLVLRDAPLREPVAITVNESGRWPEIVNFEWETANEPA